MKATTKFFIALLLLLTLFLNTSLLAYAQTAPQLNSVTPNQLPNDIARTITVNGGNFDSTAVVLLDDSALGTTFLNDQLLNINF